MENTTLDENGNVIKTTTQSLDEYVAQQKQELTMINEQIMNNTVIQSQLVQRQTDILNTLGNLIK